MLGHELAIEQGEITRPQPGDEPSERDLRRVSASAEHALAEKGSAKLDAIEAADERIAAPHLDRMGMPRGVERKHCPL
jgi:hypothetical protein